MAAIELKKTTVEEICRKLAEIYENVDLAHEPNIRWVQIVNDTTMLAEEIRRNRTDAAVERSGKILMRLLEFIGYYSYSYEVVQKPRAKVRFRDFTGFAFQAPSSLNYFKKGEPKEGLTRWISSKYPYACAKCGKRPCRCLVEPWVFERTQGEPRSFRTLQKSC